MGSSHVCFDGLQWDVNLYNRVSKSTCDRRQAGEELVFILSGMMCII